MMNMPPFGSPLNDPKVREALRGVAETQAAQADPGRDGGKRPTGSYFDDAKVVGALRRVGDGQAQSSAVFVAQNVLNGGEVSPHMLARHDQPRYQTGCERLLNMVPLPQGGITKRPGLESLGISPGAADASRGGGTAARFIPFIFSAGESRMLEMVGSDPAGSRMNLWMPDGTVREAVLELPYGSGSLGGLRYAQSADVVFLAHPGYPPAKISRHADDDWRYEAISWMPPIAAPGQPSLEVLDKRADADKPKDPSLTDYSYVVTAVDEETGMESPASPAATIEAEALNSVDYHIRIAWPPVEGASEYRVYKKKVGVFGFIGRVSADEATTTTSPSGVAGVDIGGYRFAKTARMMQSAVSARHDEGSDGTVYVLSVIAPREEEGPPYGWYSSELQRLFVYGTDGYENHTGWFGVDNGLPDAPQEYGRWTPYPGFGKSADYPKGMEGGVQAIPVFSDPVSVTSLHFDDKNLGPDTEDTPVEYRNPFDGPGKYPSVVFLHQQRLGFASSDNAPLTIWLSQAGRFESMAASTPPEDDDAVEVTLAAAQANRILWCQTDRSGLAVGTEGGEWILAGAEGGALTPSSLSFEAQTCHGSHSEDYGDGYAAPICLRAGGRLLFLQRGGRAVREFAYSFSSDRYEAADLSLLARHVLRHARVRSWAWQEEPHAVVWCALTDGTLAGLTYMREHEVVAWHRHVTPGGVIDEVEAIPGPNGDTQLWLHVLRGEKRWVERLRAFDGELMFSEAAALKAKIEQLRDVGREGRFDWTEAEVREAVRGDGYASVREWWELCGEREGVCPWNSPEACRMANYRYMAPTAAEGGVVSGDMYRDGADGATFEARCVPCMPESAVSNGSTLMRVRKINAIKCRVLNALPFRARVGESDALPVPVRGASFAARADWGLPLGAGWREGDRLELVFDGPDPATVLAVLTTVELAELAGGQR